MKPFFYLGLFSILLRLACTSEYSPSTDLKAIQSKSSINLDYYDGTFPENCFNSNTNRRLFKSLNIHINQQKEITVNDSLCSQTELKILLDNTWKKLHQDQLAGALVISLSGDGGIGFDYDFYLNIYNQIRERHQAQRYKVAQEYFSEAYEELEDRKRYTVDSLALMIVSEGEDW